MKKMKLILSSQGSVLDYKNEGKGENIYCSELMDNPFGSIDGVKDAINNAYENDTLIIEFIPGMDLKGILEQAESKVDITVFTEHLGDVAEELGSYDAVVTKFEIEDKRKKISVMGAERPLVKIA